MWTRGISSYVAALALALACAPAAHAAISDGSVDAISASTTQPGRALTKLALTYDQSAGTLNATGTFAGDPATGVAAALVVHLGTISGTTCQSPQALMVAQLAPSGIVRTTLSAAPSGTDYGGAITLSEATASVTAAHDGLKGLAYTCLWGDVRTLDGNQTILAKTDGWATMTARAEPPPPPAPTPPAAPTPTTPVAPAPVTPPPPYAKLSIGVTGIPDTVVKNRWVTAKIRVTNAGTATAKDVQLKVLRRKGVTATPTVAKLGARLKAGKSKLVKVRFKLATSAPEDVTVRLRASGKGKLSTEGNVGLVTKDGRPAPVGSAGPLKGRYFWATRTRVDYAWENHAVYFASDGWAYWGFNENGGLPVDCKSAAPKLDDKGQPTDEGCVPWRLDKATGAITVGPVTGSWKDGQLKLDELDFSELLVPAPGARFNAQLEHRGFSGFCGLITGCSTWFYQLAFADTGIFVKTRSSLTTIGDGFSTPFVAAGSYPPDQYGTYATLENGLMQLTYANGTVEKYPFGVQLKDGKPDPAGEGVVLGEDNYYVDPSPDDG